MAESRLTAGPAGIMGSGLMWRRTMAFIWKDGLVAQVTAYDDSIEDGYATPTGTVRAGGAR